MGPGTHDQEQEPPGRVVPPRMRGWAVAGVAFASSVVYGLIARLVFGRQPPDSVGLQVMTVSFIFLVPLALGFLTTTICWLGAPLRWWWRLGLPPVAGLFALGVSMVMALEGFICVVMWSPVYLALIATGSLAAEGIFQILKLRSARSKAMLGLLVALLPYAMGAVESGSTPPVDVRTVSTSIDIAAGPGRVWQEVREVRRIEEHEHRPAATQRMGFPRPIEARLVGEGIGATRLARFEGDVLFVERVTTWDPPRELAFTIAADIPPSTLDAHVTVGGPYFDVLEGRFVIEPLGEDTVRLHLSSRHRLSTPFNVYAHHWTDFVMKDVQQYILEVIRRRAESD